MAALASGIKVDGEPWFRIRLLLLHTKDKVEQTRAANTEGPFKSSFLTYEASKALAFQASEKFIADQKPPFDQHPSCGFLGRDNTVNEVQGLMKGTNRLIVGPLLGHSNPQPALGITVHVNDVPRLHVLALNPEIKGHQSFIAVGPDYGRVNRADSIDIITRRYPKPYAAGAFQFDACTPTKTVPVKVDSSKATKTFGIQFETFEEQVVSIVDQFLELAKKSAAT